MRFLAPKNPEDAPGRWRAYYEKWSHATRRQIDNRLIDLVRILTRYAPPAAIFDKAVYSAFGNPQLHQHLRSRQIDTLIISGSETDVCVLSSILAAVDYGYRVAYQSQRETPYDRALRRAFKLRAKLGDDAEINKPKWMRWHTYDRKLEELASAEAVVDAHLLKFISKLDL